MGTEFDDVHLRGSHVHLAPVTGADAAALWNASVDTDPFRFMPLRPRSEVELRAVLLGAMAMAAAGLGCTFTVRRPDSEVVGSTSYLARDRAHRRVEIGATWVTKAWQRTAVNTECKLLLMRHAFEVLDCVRVEFKTDARNAASRAALLRIGAREEGTLRAHMVMPDGHLRDSVYFSVIAAEWPRVRTGLAARLEQGRGGVQGANR